jgi:hypothetical protein
MSHSYPEVKPIATWHKDISLETMKEGDIIYIKRMIGLFDYMIECHFIEYKKGVVRAKKIRVISPNPLLNLGTFGPEGTILTARKKCCCVWGKKDEIVSWEHWHWFK